ncbi:MAG: sialidase family protein, partial [Gammaproteobacteria bacterium]
GQYSAAYKVIRSTDHGATWSAPIKIADELAVGAHDPETGQTIRDGAGLADIAVGPAGNLFVVWQDARFSNGDHDGIALSSSTDGGLSWSAPVQINADTAVEAFTPSIGILSDGTLVATYYDLRSDTSDPDTLPTDLWQVISTDGTTWHERHVSGPFDLAIAPDAEGLFLGDYQGLAAAGNDALPFFVQTVDSATGPTDVFALPPPMSTSLLLAVSAGYQAKPAQLFIHTPAFHTRVEQNLQQLLHREGRLTRPPQRPTWPD